VVIVNNLLALVFTVIFARVLEPSGYGSLAVLGATFIVMMVPRSALQVAAAREVDPPACTPCLPDRVPRR